MSPKTAEKRPKLELLRIHCMAGVSLRNEFILDFPLYFYVIFAEPNSDKTMVFFVLVLDQGGN